MSQPAWFRNMNDLFTWDVDDPKNYVFLLLWWAPAINEFIDNTLVKGNEQAQAIVNHCWSLFNAMADWSKLPQDSPYRDNLVFTYKRLSGLVSR